MKIAIISDIHSNLQALEAVLGNISDQHVDKIISLGDLIGYGGQPNEVVDLIKGMGIQSVKGNHEQALNDKYYRSLFTDFGQYSLDLTKKLLSADNLDYLEKLPHNLIFNEFLFVHGSPPADMRKYFWKLSQMHMISIFNSFKNKICFVGHTHVPSIAEFNGRKAVQTEFEGEMKLSKKYRYIINPGSVGQPRNSNSDSSYMIFNTEDLLLRHIYVKYNIDEAAEQIKKSGFDFDNAERLYTGD